ncbi:hypothetical protein CPB83DRAFT_844069 [Crepidotus variabilis]|uniref:Uncharacterized protein n=1 Tax=Crepidotus variabilis TaxID=179855 RepID=A0A9P6ESG9_9AGAR|nr:hypothetical protein CPB83DRAFT_844069 [Crepidotus variabilis]
MRLPALLLLVLSGLAGVLCTRRSRLALVDTDGDAQNFMQSKLVVPVQLGVMSRCPDALTCEAVFNDVLPSVKDKIDLSLVYIAKFDPTDTPFGVQCMHGRWECAGNVQQLCVHKYASVATWWEFVSCQNKQGRSRIGFPDVALQCAKEVGVDWEKSGAGTCAGLDGSGTAPEGVALLKESIQTGISLHLKSSCTVVINGKAVCIHDSEWKNCENGHEPADFIKQIEEEYSRLNGAL